MFVFSFFSRFGRLLPLKVQHHALPLLQSRRHLLLRQQKWQILLAVNNCPATYDACRAGRHKTIHQPLLSVWSSISCNSSAQSGHHHPTVSRRLAQLVDWLLLPHGEFQVQVPEVWFTVCVWDNVQTEKLHSCRVACGFVNHKSNS